MRGKIRGMVFLVFLLGTVGVSLVACFLFFSIGHVLKEANGVNFHKGSATVSGAVGGVEKVLKIEEEAEEFVPWKDRPKEHHNEEEFIEEEKEETFSFSVIGDSERYKSSNGYKEAVTQTWKRVKILQDDLVFFTGDIIVADGGSQQENRRRVEHVKEKFDKLFLKKNFHIVFGNHDVECGTPCVDLWQEVFFGKEYGVGEERILYRSFDYKNTHFVILSSSYPAEKSVDDKQLGWLDEDLSNSDKENVIVLSHVSPVTFFKDSAKRCHDMSCSEPSRAKLMGVLQKHSVDLVISGHEDVFDHKIESGIDFVLSGNSDGGEPRYEEAMGGQNFSRFYVEGENISLEAIDLRRGVVREIEIK